jgi:hypothetical protein
LRPMRQIEHLPHSSGVSEDSNPREDSRGVEISSAEQPGEPSNYEGAKNSRKG